MLFLRRSRARRQAPYAWSSANHENATSERAIAQARRGMLLFPRHRTNRRENRSARSARSVRMKLASSLAIRATRVMAGHAVRFGSEGPVRSGPDATVQGEGATPPWRGGPGSKQWAGDGAARGGGGQRAGGKGPAPRKAVPRQSSSKAPLARTRAERGSR